MEKQEYLKEISSTKIDQKKVLELSKKYNNKIPVLVQQIISYCSDTVFFGEGQRILSFAEMIDAEDYLGVDCKGKKILPIVDCGDNDFIVFHFVDSSWSMFNIVDEISFNSGKDFEELFL